MNNKKKFVPATLLADFYKLSHREQYPEKSEYVYSPFTPRKSRIEDIDKVVAVGFQGFSIKYLIDYFNNNFFDRKWEDVEAEYVRVIKYCLNKEKPYTKHLKELHELGYIPIEMKAVPEGSLVPMRCPVLTIENTDPRFFWLTNYLETLMSCEIWLSMTSATTAYQYRKILDKYAQKTSSIPEFVDFQGHDFSMRGMSSLESSMLSGFGHLTSFRGTDTVPSICYAEQYYNADIEKELVGCSVSATEHSVQCSNGMDEYKTYKRLITEVYPDGIISIVSDTWDLWDVVGRVIPDLKNEIMNREGKVVIRPDSGIPENILCGDDNEDGIARKGLIQALWEIFGGTINKKGYKELDSHIGAIYGEAITTERCETICKRLEEKGFASTNIVFGIGSYTYNYVTRDTYGFALKATDVIIDGTEHKIYKNPKTDTDGFKKSQKGRVVVLKDKKGNLYHIDNLTIKEVETYKDDDILQIIFKNGVMVKETSLSEIRKRLSNEIKI